MNDWQMIIYLPAFFPTLSLVSCLFQLNAKLERKLKAQETSIAELQDKASAVPVSCMTRRDP